MSKIDLQQIDDINSKCWSDEVSNNILLYPDENVVRFLAQHFPDRAQNVGKNALDVGFGSGRHLKLLRDYNFNIFGIDYSEDACTTARKLFNLDSEIQNINLKQLEIKPDFYHAIVAYGVLFYNKKKQILKDLIALRKALRPNNEGGGGRLLVNFRSTDDVLLKRARKTGEYLGNNFYILHDARYKNLAYQFLNKKQILKLVKQAGFSVEEIQKIDWYRDNLKTPFSWYILHLSK